MLSIKRHSVVREGKQKDKWGFAKFLPNLPNNAKMLTPFKSNWAHIVLNIELKYVIMKWKFKILILLILLGFVNLNHSRVVS